MASKKQNQREKGWRNRNRVNMIATIVIALFISMIYAIFRGSVQMILPVESVQISGLIYFSWSTFCYTIFSMLILGFILVWLNKRCMN